jgi:hypothetical protein
MAGPFDEAELQSNRQGRLSAAQMARLEELVQFAADPRFTLRPGLGALAQQDLEEGKVASAEGEVGPGGQELYLRWKCSQARLEGFPEGLDFLRGEALPPGRYRVFYLPVSKLAVAAEPLSSETELRWALQRELLTALDVTEVELGQNRQGQVSPEQLRSLGESVRVLQWVGRGVLTFGAVIALSTVAFAFQASQGHMADTHLWMLVLPMALSTVPLGLGLFARQTVKKQTAVLAATKLEAHEGALERHSVGVRTYQFFATVDGRRFDVPQGLWEVLVSGRQYRVHWAPEHRAVLSVEAL